MIPRWKETFFTVRYLLFLPIFLLVIGLGCDGVQGPDGQDTPDFDHRPPEIELLWPTPNTELIGDTLMLHAEAHDSLGEVVRVEFLVNGSNRVGEDSAVVFEEPFQYLYRFDTAGTPYGYISIQSIATDTAGNHQESPLFLLNRKQYEGIDTLSYYNDAADEVGWLIPDSLQVFDQEGEVIDTTYMPQIGTRFTSMASGELRETGLLFRNLNQYNPPNSFWLILYRIDSPPAPGIATDSLEIAFSSELEDVWIYVDLSTWNDGLPYHFEAGEHFVLAVRVDEDQVSSVIRLALSCSHQSATSAHPEWERGVIYTEYAGWETIGEHYQNAGEYRPTMQVVMEYDNSSDR